MAQQSKVVVINENNTIAVVKTLRRHPESVRGITQIESTENETLLYRIL